MQVSAADGGVMTLGVRSFAGPAQRRLPDIDDASYLPLGDRCRAAVHTNRPVGTLNRDLPMVVTEIPTARQLQAG